MSVSKWAGLGQNKMCTRSYADREFELFVCIAGVWRYQQETNHSYELKAWWFTRSVKQWRGINELDWLQQPWSQGRGTHLSGECSPESCMGHMSRIPVSRPWLSSQEHTGQLETAYQIGSDACETMRRNLGHPLDHSWTPWSALNERNDRRWRKVTQTELQTYLESI